MKYAFAPNEVLRNLAGEEFAVVEYVPDTQADWSVGEPNTGVLHVTRAGEVVISEFYGDPIPLTAENIEEARLVARDIF